MLDNIKELYRFRSLVSALVVRHLSMRYRGSLLGFLWSILNPLCLMLIYTLVFRYYIRFDQVENYTIFLFCGLLPWLWLSTALNEGASSIVSSGHLITKSMFPAHLLPTVSVITNLVNFVLSLPLLFLFMAVAGMEFHRTLVLLPVVVVAQILFLHGLVLALGALNVHFRDVQHVVGNLLTFVFFLCPILYPPDVVPAKLRFTLDFNPFAVFTTIYHNIIIQGVWPSFSGVVFLSCMIVGSFIIGNLIYNYYREGFAELL